MSGVKLRCQVCHTEGEYPSLLFAWQEGWDYAPVITCPNCPSAPLIIELMESTTIEQKQVIDDFLKDD